MTAAEPIYGATQKDVELYVEKLFVISTAQTPLPIQIEDAERSQPLIDAQVRYCPLCLSASVSLEWLLTCQRP